MDPQNKNEAKESKESHRELIMLVSLGDDGSVKQFLKKGWDPNVQNDDGITPALMAAERNDLEMLKILINAGADVTRPDIMGYTPLKYAQYHKNEEMVKLLKDTEQQQLERPKDRYLVDFDKPLTEPDPYADLKSVSPLQYKGAEITFPHFVNLVNVHTAPLLWHDNRDSVARFRNKLYDKKGDVEIIGAYYQHIADKQPELLLKLAKTIPQSESGTQLCLEAFGCDPKELRQQALENGIRTLTEQLDHLHTDPETVTLTERLELLDKFCKIIKKLETLGPSAPTTLPSTMQQARSESSSSSRYSLPAQKGISPMSKEELEQKKPIQAKTEALETINDQSSLDQGTAGQEHTRPRSPGNK